MDYSKELIHPINGQVNVVKIVENLEKIRDHLYEKKSKIIQQYPTLNPSLDARVTGFTKFINVLTSSQLGCAFWAKNLLSDQWWKENTSYIEDDRKIIRSEFQGFIFLGLHHFSFSTIESTIRAIMRGLDPHAHAGAASDFKRIYDDLLMNRLSIPHQQLIEFLDFFSCMRNTIHNNGIYFHKSGNGIVRIYRNNLYTFDFGKKIKFATWPLLFELLSDSAKMLETIAFDTNVVDIKGDILDPASL